MKSGNFRTACGVVLLSGLMATLLAALVRTWKRLLLVSLPLLLPSGLYAGYALVAGVPPGHAMAVVVASMSLEELLGAMQVLHGGLIAGGIIAAILSYMALLQWVGPQRIFQSSETRMGLLRGKILVSALALSLLFLAASPADVVAAVHDNPVTGTLLFLYHELPQAKAELRGSLVHKVPFNAHRAGGEEVHVLVIGESVRRDSWSALGYRRPTTPFVTARRNEETLFTNAVADANLTSWSVPIILTGVAPDQYGKASIRGNLVDVAKSAGFETAWLVNQDVFISRYVGIAADHEFDAHSTRAGVDPLDESLLPAFKAEVARLGHARFIGLHIMGSHWFYANRYPRQFAVFGPHDVGSSSSRRPDFLVDEYDDSIRYTDWFLQQLIDTLKVLHVPATLTYVPDHGEGLESLDGEAAHGAPHYTKHAFEIPVLIWTNEAFRKAHPEKISALESNSAKMIRSHDIFYTVADLMGVTWKGFLPARSVASPEFAPDLAAPYAAGGVLVRHP